METIDKFERHMQQATVMYDVMRTQKDAAVVAMEGLRARIATLEAALRPFADARLVDVQPDGNLFKIFKISATGEDLARARAALDSARREGEPTPVPMLRRVQVAADEAAKQMDDLSEENANLRSLIEQVRNAACVDGGTDLVGFVADMHEVYVREKSEPAAPPTAVAESGSFTSRQHIHAQLDAIFDRHAGDAADGLFFAVRTYVYSLLSELAAPPAEATSPDKLIRDRATPEKAKWWDVVGEAARNAPVIRVAEAAEGPIALPVSVAPISNYGITLRAADGCTWANCSRLDAVEQIAAALNRSAEDDKKINARNLLITEQIDEIARLREGMQLEIAHHQETVRELDSLREQLAAAERARDTWILKHRDEAALSQEFERELDEARAERERDALELCTLRLKQALTAHSPERVSQLLAHRACGSEEHDPQNGKIHGCCVVCLVPWPCEFAERKEGGG